MKKLNYKKIYFQIFNFLNKKNIIVYDTAIHGPGLAVDFNACIKMQQANRLICVDGKISWKKRLFVMLHEVGHLFFYKNFNLIPRKICGSELQANKTAIKLLILFSENLIKTDYKVYREYAKYYNSMQKGSNRAKFILD